MTNEEIYDLMARFERSTLSSLRLADGRFELEMNKGGVPASAPAAPAAPVSVPCEAPAPAVKEGPAVKAPLVGCYYSAPAPDQPPFVSVGDRVKKGQTLCLIEAMKMMSEIPAPCDCVIEAVLKENGALVAYQEPLFRYKAV